MIIQSRKTYERILSRALRKCSRMYIDGVHCCCTPVEYLVLCTHFAHPEQSFVPYYIDQIANGQSDSAPHYFKVNEGVESFKQHEHSLLHVKMAGWSC